MPGSGPPSSGVPPHYVKELLPLEVLWVQQAGWRTEAGLQSHQGQDCAVAIMLENTAVVHIIIINRKYFC